MTSDLPPEVDQLLRERIGSIEQLNALLLLHRGQDRRWSAVECSAELGIPVLAANDALEQLVDAKLISRSAQGNAVRFYYSPTTSFDHAVTRLQEECEREAVEVLRAMNANAFERVRTSATRAFGDVLRIVARRRAPPNRNEP